MAERIRKEDKGLDYKKRFLNGLKILTRSRSTYEVWSDAMYLFATGIANPSILTLRELKPFDDVWNEREQEYLRIIKKYSKKEQKLFPQMLALLVEELEKNPNQDLLGEIYMMAGISNKDKGQFFTPYSLCDAMSRIVFDRKKLGKQVHKEGYASVCDPACGAGATLIAAINVCREMFKKYNFQNHVMFVGQDIDRTVANMCYIQLSLQGVAGYVTVGNTLTEPVITDLSRIWFTPMWFSNVWAMRRLFHGQDILGREVRKKDEKQSGNRD